MHPEDTKDTKNAKEKANELSHEVLGAALEVHRLLGPGLLESTHETCLSHELTLRGVRHARQALTYLRLSGLRVGLLMNFNVPVLRSGIRRLIS